MESEFLRKIESWLVIYSCCVCVIIIRSYGQFIMLQQHPAAVSQFETSQVCADYMHVHRSCYYKVYQCYEVPHWGSAFQKALKLRYFMLVDLGGEQ